MREKLKKLLFSTMAFLMVAQVVAPTIVVAADINNELYQGIATLEDFEYIDGEYSLTIVSQEEISIDFDYEVENDISNFDFNLNDKVLSLEQDNSLIIGENTIKIQEKTDDKLVELDVLVQGKSIDLVEVVESESDMTLSELNSELSSAPNTESGPTIDSEAFSEIKSEVSIDKKTVKAPRAAVDNYHEALIERNAEYGYKEFMKKAVMEGDYSLNPEQEMITLIPTTNNNARGLANSIFRIDGSEPFEISAYVRVEPQQGDAADAFSIVFSGADNPFTYGGSGNSYGLGGLPNSFALVWDYFDNGTNLDANFQIAETDVNGVKIDNYNLMSNNDFKVWSNNDRTMEIKMISDGKGTLKATAHDVEDNKDHEFEYDFSHMLDGDYFVRFAASQGGRKSRVDVSQVSIKADVINVTKLIHENGPGEEAGSEILPDEKVAIKWGSKQEVALYAANTLPTEQHIILNPIKYTNYVEQPNSFYSELLGGQEVFHEGQYLQDGFDNDVPGEISGKMSTVLKVTEPRGNREKQVELLADNSVQTAIIDTSFNMADVDFYPVHYDEHILTGDPATFSGGKRYVVPSLNLQDNDAVLKYLLEETEFAINDPYLDEMTQEEILASPRTSITPGYNATTGTNVIKVTYFAINNEEITRDIEFFTDELELTKEVKDTGLDQNDKDAIATEINGKAEAGEQLEYKVSVTNKGVTPVTNISLTDNMDNNLDKSSLSIVQVTDGTNVVDAANYSLDGTVFTFVEIPGQTTYTITYTVNVKFKGLSRIVKDMIKNTVVATSDTIGSTNEEASAEIEINKQASGMSDLTVTKSFVAGSDSIDKNDLATANETLTYQLVLNNSNSALNQDNVVVTDIPDDNDIFGTMKNVKVLREATELKQDTDYTITGNVINIKSIPAGATYKITYEMITADIFVDDSSILNTITVDGDDVPSVITTSATIAKDTRTTPGVDATIAATDAHVKQNEAPSTEADLLTLLNAQAYDIDGENLTSKILVTDLNDYNYAEPNRGEYVITLGAAGTSGKFVTTTVRLTVLANNATPSKIDMLLTTPVFVQNVNKGGANITDKEVVDQLILPYILESNYGTEYEPYAITSANLVSNGGFDNGKNGIYAFKLVATGVKSGLEVEEIALVTVADDISGLSNVATIDGKNIKVLEGSHYNNSLAPILHKANYKVVTGLVYEKGNVKQTVELDASNVLKQTVDTSTTGKYQTSFYFASETSDKTPVSVVEQFDVEVVAADPSKNAVINATDSEVKKSDAPSTEAQLLDLLKVEAFEANGTNITSKIKIESLGGYDLNTPVVGNFDIELSVLGNDDLVMSTTAKLKVVEDNVDTNEINMVFNSPVFVEKGNKLTDKQVVDQLILPFVLETINGTSNEPYAITSSSLVSNGGYDNATNGTYTFKLVATGTKTGLEVERAALVVVANDITDLDAVATIDGKNIKVLEGSHYNNSLAPILHKANYKVVTGLVYEKGNVKQTVELDASNVLKQTVDTSTTGKYQTSFYFASETSDKTPVSVVEQFDVEVVAADPSKNAVINATDSEVKKSDAPSTEAQLLDLLKVEAFEANGTNITSKIKIESLGGYDLNTPVVGNFDIELSVLGNDDLVMSTTAKLKVVEDNVDTNEINMVFNSPVFVEKGNKLTDKQVVDQLILPFVLETINGTSNEPYAITSSSLVSNGGYDNTTNGTYTFKLVATGTKTGLEVERAALVVVANDITDLDAVAKIDAKDIKILTGSYYDKDVASVLHKENYSTAAALVYESGLLKQTVGLNESNVMASDVDENNAGMYSTTFYYTGQTSNKTPVSAVKTLNVQVLNSNVSENAVITATDLEVDINNAPTTEANLLSKLEVQAYEVNGKDITDKVKISSLGGYNLDSPTTGTFPIILNVTGQDGITVTTTAKLKVVANGEATNSIDMLLSTPVFVKKGNGLTDKQVVDQLILPYVLETINGTSNEPYAITSTSLVSNGGYANSTNGTYTFKLVATGTKTGLEVERAALVVVANDITDLEAVATIDGADIKVLEGSYYGKDVASVLHKDKYDVVTAEVTESSEVTPVALTSADILQTTVDTKTVGMYATTYRFASSDYAAPVSVVRNLAVEVVEADASKNAVISATDSEVELSDAPAKVASVLTTLNAEAFEANGTDLTAKIEVVDFGGYDVAAPAVGTFTITLSVVGSDDVTVTTTAKLKVVADGEATNSIDMLLSTPVFVKKGNGLTDKQVVDQLILPYVLETINGTSNEPYAITSTSLVSNGGYANATNGTYTFKLVATGTKTGLEVERAALVVVANDITDLEAVATIDGANIKVLAGSYYGKDVASVLHKDKYDVVTAEVTESTEVTPVALTSADILKTTVDTKTAGTYATTYRFASSDYAAPVSVVRNLAVEVVEADASKNAVISATDREVELSNAPAKVASVLTTLNAEAFEANGTDLTAKIEVLDFGGYDVTAPAVGTFTITLSVVGSDDVQVTTTAKLKVVADGAETNSIDMLLSTPVFVKKGNGLTDKQVVDQLILPYVLEIINGTSNEPYAITSTSLVSNGGYANATNGTYTFKLVATGTKTGLEVERAALVVVADDITDLEAVAKIDGADIKVLEGSYYGKDVASVLHKDKYDVVTAEVNESSEVTSVALTSANVLTTNVDTETAGTYATTYRFASSDYAAPVSVVRNLAVEVVEADASKNAVISATDSEVELSDAPAKVASVLTTLNAEAFEANGTDLTAKIEVLDFGGYDVTAPAVGTFTITLSVVGSDDVQVTTTAKLKVVADGTATNSIDMLLSTPVFVKKGNGLTDKQVVDQLILPHVLETIGGASNEPYAITSTSLVSNGGYDNTTNRTYTFKLVTTGTKTGLEVERAALVVVADDITDLEAVATIDGADITVLEGSYYGKDVASVLHKDNYDAVTAEVNQSGVVTPVELTEANILTTNVDTEATGTYATTYRFASSDYAAPVSVVRNLTVEVVKPDKSNNAVINATDSEVELGNAPKSAEGLLNMLNAEAFEANGTDLTAKIEVVDFGGYDVDAPAVGTFDITLSVVGSDDVQVTTTANLKVVADGEATNAIDMLLSTPVFVKKGNGLTDKQVVDQLIIPYVLETMDGVANEPYAISSTSLVTSSGYKNNTKGTYTFKLVATGTKTGLEVERAALVVVADDITDLEAVATIDGANIKVLAGSYYSKEVASVLHKDNYDVVTAEVTESSKVTPVSLTSSDILTTNVDTKAAGTYATTYSFASSDYAAPVSVVRNLSVEVVEADASKNAVITATDSEVELSKAPAKVARVLTTLNAEAFEANGTDITSKIEVVDFGGYDVDAPAVGTFTITLSVVGSDDVQVTTTAKLKVVADGAETNSIDMLLSTPVFVKKGNGLTDKQVVDQLILPYVLETINGTSNEPYAITSTSLVSNGGYANATNGTYTFKLVATGTKTGLEVERAALVVVADDITDLEAVAKIDGADIKVLEGSYYGKDVASVLHKDKYDVVTAEVNESSEVTSVALTSANVLTTNVDTETAGTYATTYRFASSDYAAPISVVRNLAVEVVEADASKNAVISATDSEVELSNAPAKVASVLTTLNAEAFEANGTDLTAKIEVVDFGGYDVAAPAIGTFTITLSVVGSDDVQVTTTANLKVVADGEATNAIDMLLSTPVFVKKGNGLTDKQVVDQLILPHVLETINGTSNEPYAITSSSLVSNGGYANATNGTYTFKLVATGTKTGLEVERAALVVVADDITDLYAVATIDGANIKVLEGSYYGKDVASVLHKDKYDVVTAEVTESSKVTPVALTSADILKTTVDTKTAGTYATTYRFASSDYAAPVSVVRNLAVEVVEADASKNAVISATDSEVELSNAPAKVASVLTTLNAEAFEANGTDLTAKIEVLDFGGYDVTAPAVGTFTITLSVVGSDDVQVTTTAKLKVVADGTATNKVEMLLSTPVFVKKGNGLTDKQVVDQLILPYVLETIGGASNEPYAITSTSLVSNGGYDNTTNRTYTFKLVATGTKTGLEVERAALVVVADDITDLEAVATIDGANIKVLEGSYYSKEVASVLHKDNYDVVTAEVNESSEVTAVALTSANVLTTNVDTETAGTYATTYRFASSDYAAPVSVVRNLAVEVVEADASKNAVINATDSEVELNSAPVNVADLMTTLNAEAFEANGTDLTSKIEVVDFGGYDVTAPAVGTFTITLSVVGSDDVQVTTTAKLKVVADGEATNAIDILLSTPVFVKKGNGLTDKQVVDQLILPHLLETINGASNEPYAITSSSLVSNGGYDNTTNRTYTFKLVATGTKTGLEVERAALVVVADDITDLEAVATIDGADIKVLEGSYYGKDVASVLHKDKYDVVTAEVTESTEVTSVALTSTDILTTNVDTKTAGTYATTYRFASSDYAAPVSVVRNLAVEVVEADASKNAVISATDSEVELSDAPTKVASVLTTLNAEAFEANGTDLTAKIEVLDFGGYDVSAPAVGTFTITLSVVGSDDVQVTTTVNLKVVADGTATNSIDMLLSTPVFVKKGNGLTDKQVVDQLILPYVLETIGGASNEPYAITSTSLVSNGGYDNTINRTYTFKLVATGTKTGLEVERAALVVVADDITDLEAVATIDGADIKVLEGSYYGKDVASVLHKDNYDAVTAEVNQSGVVTPVELTEANILTTNVDTEATGTYATTYRFASSDYAAPVSVVRNLTVEVVKPDKSNNAVINATDSEVELGNAPKSAEGLLNMLNAEAFEANGTDLTAKIEVVDFGGYDVDAPAVGTFDITLSVVGSDDVQVTTTANLKVVADGEATNAIDMLLSTPVFVKKGNGLTDKQVVDQLIIPYVLETMDGVANEPYAISSTSLVTSSGYKNNTKGTYTFKLVATGTKTGLEVERAALVVVADDITDLEAVATIDGANIKVLAGSYYSKEVASVLHKDNYDVVTAEVTESSKVTPVSLTSADILTTNVDTKTAGTYATTYRFASSDYAAPVSVVRNLAVEVVEADASKNAVISATDSEVELSDAPAKVASVLTTLNAEAFEANGTDLTSEIKVVDFGGYDVAAPAVGTFIITLSVVGSDDVQVTTTANLKVVADGEATNSIDMLLSTPVFVKKGNGLTDKQVVDQLILPYVLETINGTSNEPYAITSTSLVSNGGYANATNGTYTFKLVATGTKTGLEVERAALVVVAGDITDLEAVATIDGADIKVLEGSYYSKEVASVLHKDNYDVVTAEVTESSEVTPVALTSTDILTTNVDTKTAGTYATTYRFASSDYAAPVSVVRNLAVEVVEADASKNAVISATDSEVELSDAPANDADLMATLNAEAFEANGTDLTSKIEVVNFDGYDVTAPAVGTFTITLSVVGSDDVQVTTTANLKIVADGEATNSIDMLLSTPVFVENGNGLTDKQVVDQLIMPYVLETMGGASNEPYAITSTSLVSNGGYDNTTNRTYTFKLVATGVETGLEVERAALVVVADDITDLEAVATIDGADIKVLEGSYYSKEVASVLHKDNYDVVTAEVTESSKVTPVELTEANILATNVDTETAGTYLTTYRFASNNFAAPVSVVRNLAVEVVETDASKNAVISATDSEVELSNAPANAADLMTTLNAEAFEANGIDLTAKIEVLDFGGYDVTAPAVGTFAITLSVVGSDDVQVTTTANLKVVTDGEATNKVEMLLSTPVFVENGNGLTDKQVVDQLILPYVLETINGANNEPYAITSSSLVSNGGYDNTTNRTYTFKLVATGVETGLEVERAALVVVAGNITDLEAVATVDGTDIKVLEGSYYGKDVASVLHKDNYDVVTAEVNESGTVTPVGLTADNIITTNVNTNAAGTYNTTYSFTSRDFASPVSVVRNLAVEVVATNVSENAVISATDSEVELAKAPTNVASVLTTLNAEAFEANGTDLTAKIEVVDMGGYDVAAPAVGTFTLTLSVVGNDEVMVTTTANLTVVADGEATNAIDMLLSTPVFVKKGNGLTDKQVVDQLILPHLLETINGASNEPYAITSSSLVSNGGYDNSTNRTYTFKLAATGVETGLEVERAALVVVAGDITDLEVIATIDGADIKVLEGSYYSKDVASVLHKDNFDVVTAEVTESGTVTPVALTAENIIATNVNTDSAGTYATTYSFVSGDFAVPVSVVRSLAVEVVEADASKNAVISATDSEVELAKAPADVASVLTTLNAEAFEANGTDLTAKIEVVDFGGYDITAPAVGSFTITLSVVGSDDVQVTTTANLKVVADGEATNAIKMLLATPVFVENGNGLTDAQVVDQLILPYVLETISGTNNEAYAITSASLVSNGGYQNGENGTYTFKLVATGIETGLEVERAALVVVSDNITDLETVATIDGTDIKVLEGSYYAKDLATVLHKDNYDFVTGLIHANGQIVAEESLSSEHVIKSDANTNEVAKYSTVFYYEYVNPKNTYSLENNAKFSTMQQYTVEVVEANPSENAVINGTDSEVELSSAPTTVKDLLATINAEAFEANGTDLSSKIEVIGLGGYDYTAPNVGTFTITLSVVGSDNVQVTTTANLTVVADGSSTNTIEMSLSTPVFVENGNGLTDAEVVEGLILPYVLETIDGVANEPYAISSTSLVSNGGYDNTTNRTYTFKLVATGVETGLEVERAALVVVAGNITDLEAVATVDGTDIKVLEGSYYSKEVASVLHKDNYDVVTAEVNESGTVTPVGLTADNIITTNVNTNAAGTYVTTYSFVSKDFAAPVSVVRNLAVEVVEADTSKNAVISATDAEVELSSAPANAVDLLKTLNAEAFEANGTDLTAKIEVVDFGGYDVTAPAVGTFTITLSAIGSDGFTVQTRANLTVVTDGEETNAIEMSLSTPVFVENGNGLTDKQVVDQLIVPYVLETIGGASNEPYAITSSSLVSNGGYNNTINRTYTFKLVATGVETGLEVERAALVVVADDITDLEAVATIDGADIKVLEGSYYGKDVASVLHKDNYDVVTAEVTETSEVTPVSLTSTDILTTNVDTKTAGTYATTYRFASSDYAMPVSVVRNLAVEVVEANSSENAVITATDSEVELNSAPVNAADLITTLNAEAFEANGADLTSKIEVVDFGGYDVAAPAVGTFTITLSVVGTDDVQVTTTANLTVVADGEATNAIDMLLSTPVFVENGNGLTDKQVVDQLILPYVLETVGVASNEPYAITNSSLVSNGGYDNTTNRTYTFKLVATGVETGLEVERAALVVVADDITDLEAVATIDGADIKVLEGSYYSKEVASVLHKDNYDVVTAEVTESSKVIPVSLTSTDILTTNVDTKTAGTYATTYRFASSDYAAPVSVVRNLAVEVVEADFSENAVISSTDSEVELSNAPTNAFDLLEVLDVTAYEANGIDISDKIEVHSLGGYILDTPQVGSYEITTSVVGSDGILVTTSATLTVVEDGLSVNKVEMILSSPVFVEKGNGMTDKNVVDMLVAPYVIETLDGMMQEPYAITSSSLVSNGGYNNSTNGTYTFKLVATGTKSGLEVEKAAIVTVTDDISEITNVALIDGIDIRIPVGTDYTVDNASQLHANNYDVVTALVYENGKVVEEIALDVNDIATSNVDTYKEGTYKTTYYYVDEDSYSKPVSVVKEFKVTVVSPAEILEELEFTKEVSDADMDGLAELNEVLSYSITLKNNSDNLLLSDITISDSFDSEYLDVSQLQNITVVDGNNIDITNQVLTVNDQKLIVDLAEFMPGDVAHINFEQKLGTNLINGHVIDNVATVTLADAQRQSNNAPIEIFVSEVTKSKPEITVTGSMIIMYIIGLMSAIILLITLKRKYIKQ